MRVSRNLLILTVLNLVLLAFSIVQQFRPVFAGDELPILRGRGLQIVDAEGRVRASIAVIEPTAASGGDEAETVLLRLITEKGRPTVKIAASEPSSGLSFAGPTDTKSTYAILQAKGDASVLKLSSENGRQQVVSP